MRSLGRLTLPLLFGIFTCPVGLQAANLFSVNNSDGQGVSGGLLATPPGSCTGVPGGAPGDCSLRASAAVKDWAGGQYAYGTTWSDLEHAPLPAGTNQILPNGSVVPIASLAGALQSDIGKSWIPDSCNRPWCGNLLRGDVQEDLDENGDGKWDDTWIDKNSNGIRDNGEVDRTRAEQFAWGLTSVNRDFSDLSLVTGNVSPPGVVRMRTRLALGDASQNGGCDGNVANPACLDGVIGTAAAGNDARIWGQCDPDRFTGIAAADPIRGQRALDNCLWFFASFPITAPSPGGYDPLSNLMDSDLATGLRPGDPLDPLKDPFARRDSSIAQRVTKYVSTSVPGQDFTQNWVITYQFRPAADAPDDLRKAIYHNEWRMSQTDTGDDDRVYPYSFLVQQNATARRWGFTFEPAPGEPPAQPLPGCVPDPRCGTTNDTVDPFWGKALKRTGSGLLDLDANGLPQFNFDQNFEFLPGETCGEACMESGVGRETEFSFLFEQDVEGFLLSCLDCGHPAPGPSDPVTYSFDWPAIPSIVGVPVLPPSSTILPVTP